MKAIVYNRYGTPQVLQLQEVEKPMPKPNEVLVKVHAASVNSWDWDLVTGKPFFYRLLFGIFKPRHKIIGSDIAGTVEAIGSNVTKFKPGDTVFGDISGQGFGAFAEYACAPENLLAHKPASMSIEEAAAIPQAGVLAHQGLKMGKIKPGSQVLINGAGGGVGTIAIQIAKLLGAEVTAVDSTPKFKMLQSVGADHVIDYTKEDYTQLAIQNGRCYDFILDVIARRPLSNYKKALNPGGTFVIVGGDLQRIFQLMIFGSLMTLNEKKKMVVLMHTPNSKDLEYLSTLFESGQIKPIIDKCYPLRQTAEAVQYLGDGKALGKVVITM